MSLVKEPVTEPVTFPFSDGKQLTSVIDPETKHHIVTCDLCGSTINLGMWASGHPLIQHRGSATCNKKAHIANKKVAKKRLLVS